MKVIGTIILIIIAIGIVEKILSFCKNVIASVFTFGGIIAVLLFVYGVGDSINNTNNNPKETTISASQQEYNAQQQKYNFEQQDYIQTQFSNIENVANQNSDDIDHYVNEYVYANVDTHLILRNGPSTDYEQIGKIQNGEKMYAYYAVINFRGYCWYYVDYNGTNGYVIAKYTTR